VIASSRWKLQQEAGMHRRTFIAVAIAGAVACSGLAFATEPTPEAKPAAPELTPAQKQAAAYMTGQARAWADQVCGGKWVITDLLADDFHGTAPKGARYDKPTGEPVFDANTKWSKDCKLDAADVHFFGADVAVIYGAESKTVDGVDGKPERRCLVWTDTWMHRNGKWQIIAVQDNRIDCPVADAPKP
jgi:hypothetical protein